MRSSLGARARVFLFSSLVLASVSAHAAWVYGAPYSYNTAFGSAGGFLSVDEAVNSFISNYESSCASQLTCKPHTFSISYASSTSNTAAAVTINYVNPDGTTGKTFGGYIWATDVTGTGFAPKNSGGCRTMCTGGNGSAMDTLGPRGSSQEGGTKTASTDVGTPLEGDPINAANGSAFRQDTDLHTSPWLTFRRFYNSSSYVVSTTMGPKWRHSFDRSINLMPSSGADGGLIYARRPDGALVRFWSKSGLWTADSDAAETLAVNKDATTGAFTGYALRVAATRETETYDVNGRLLSIADDNGATTTLSYSDAATDPAIAPSTGLLIAVTDPQGRVLNFRYDAQGRLSKVTDPAGQSAAYVYGDNGNLVKVTYADNSTRQYLYAEPAYAAAPSAFPSELTGVVDEKGVRFETITYDSKNRGLTSQFAGGADKISLYYYNFSSYGGIPAQLTTPLGLVVQLNFVDDGAQTLKPSGAGTLCGNQCNQPWQSAKYDVHGYPASFTDFRGTQTLTTYDANGLLTKQVEASGADAQRTTSTTWDVFHRQPLTRVTTNAKGVVVAQESWAYNARGQVTAACAIDATVTTTYVCGSQAQAPAGVRQTRYTYCDAVDSTQCPRVGLLLTVDRPRTDVVDLTRYTYYLTTDESGCATIGGTCHRAGDLFQVVNAAGQATTFMAYDRHGRPVRQKDANGVITDVAYTPRGWLASRIVRGSADGVPSSADAITTLTYEATGALKTVTDADGVTTTFTYDDAHRLVDIADAVGNHINYTLDASGNRIKEETFDAAGTSRRVLARKYNTLGQLVSVTDGRAHTVFDATASGSYDANGNLVAAKDALGVARKDTFDALNRLVTHVDNANGTDAATKATTSVFAIDAMDQLTSVTDPDGLATIYNYDGLGNPTGQTSPDTGTQSATFDAAGNPVSHTDAKATVATHGYDALGRKTSTTYVDASLNVAYSYDDANSVTGCATSFPVGRLTRIVESAVTTVYCYDNQGRVTEKRQTQGQVTDVTDYLYTRAGRIAAVASPSGLVTEYGRDALGQITTVTVTPPNGAPSQVVTSATYLPFGPLVSYALGNGQSVTRTYDANYAVTDVVSPALNLHFARDAMGNITALGNSTGANPAIETYSYDPLYRLTSVTGSAGSVIEAYTYSKTGDRLSKTGNGLATGTYGYQANSHWLTSIGNSARTYDANGNTTGSASGGETFGYGYNGRNRLTVVQRNGQTVATYTYNAAGQRIAKNVSFPKAVNQRFAYDEGSQLLGEYGSVNRDYVWLEDMPVAAVDTMGPNNTINFVHSDGLDTPRAITDSSGATIWQWALQGNPFGEQQPTSTSGYALNLRFSGQYYDAESNVADNMNRHFDAAVGRYLQSDPIGLDGGINTYSYVEGSPLIYVDPLGLCNCSNILNNARSIMNSSAVAASYAYSGTHYPGPNTNKCNTFVGDVLSDSGVQPKRWFGLRGPISAGDWADPMKEISHFPIVNDPRPGDIVAISHHYSDASGHVAVVEVPGKSTIGAGGVGVHSTGWPWDPATAPQGKPVYRRCTCN